MRIRHAIPVAALTLAACAPSGPYTVVSAPAPAPRPTPPPPPVRVAPLQITVVRSDADRLLVQTSRYAYVALFEVVPGRGVALLHPAPAGQRDAQTSGTRWVDVEWMMRTRDDDRRYSNARGAPETYVYALASDRPLRITDGAYRADYMRRALGPSAYEASDPNVTARALSRWFLTPTTDEHWGEHLYAMPVSYYRGAPRVARVYCRDGTVFEVREEIADRALCPSDRHGRGDRGTGGAPPGRVADAPPDSIVGAGGQRMAQRPTPPRASIPISRAPVDAPNDQPPRTEPERPTDPRATGGGREHDDNGRRAHGDPANADPRGRGVGRGNGGRDTSGEVTQQAKASDKPAEQPPPRVVAVDSSRKAPESAQPSGESKDKEKDKEKDKPTAKDAMNEALRRTGLKRAAAKPDSASTPAPAKP